MDAASRARGGTPALQLVKVREWAFWKITGLAVAKGAAPPQAMISAFPNGLARFAKEWQGNP